MSPRRFRSRQRIYLQNGNGVIAGVTRDAAGAILPSCQVLLFTMSNVLVGQQISDSVTGAFSFTVGGNDKYYEVAMLLGAPDRAGATIEVQIPAPVAPATQSFNPTTLNLSGYWRASYGGPPWVGTASAGVSGSRNMITNTATTPSVGTAVNGLTPATCDVTHAGLDTHGIANLEDYFNAGQQLYSGWALAKFTAACSNNLVQDPFGRFVIFIDITGGGIAHAHIHGGVTDGDVATGAGVLVSGTWYLIQWKVDFASGSIKIRVNGAAWISSGLTVGDTLNGGTEALMIGDAQGGATQFFGDVLEVGVSPTVISDADFDSIRTGYVLPRYSLTV